MTTEPAPNTDWEHFLIKEEDISLLPEQVPLGEGSFGVVYRGKWMGIPVAVKKLLHRSFNTSLTTNDSEQQRKAQESVRRFHQEYQLMSKLHHLHIVQLFGIYVPDGRPDTPPAIVMELLSKTLRELIINGPDLMILEVIDNSLQILSALIYLHGQSPPVIHRDLSTNNIMVSSSGQLKIVDLGLAKIFDKAVQEKRMSSQAIGNASYMPAEVLMRIKKDYDERLDVFSCNIVTLEMSIGQVPQPCMDYWERHPEGPYFSPIPETTRFAADLKRLAIDNPVRPIIIDLMKPISDLSFAANVHKRFETTRQSYCVIEKTSEAVRRMRLGFEQQEKLHQSKMNDLEKKLDSRFQELQGSIDQKVENSLERSQAVTQGAVEEIGRKQEAMQSTLEAKMKEVSASQQMSQDMLKKLEHTTKERVDELETFVESGMTDVKADIETKTSACQKSITKEMQWVSQQVQTFNKGQEEMSRTLKSTKTDVDDLKATTTATRGKVEEVGRKQEAMQSTLEAKMKEVSASQQMSQDMLKKSENAVKGRVDELKTFVRNGMTDVKADIEMKTSACQESITKETQQVSRQVQAINKEQEEMSKTLKLTKVNVDDIKEITAATRGQVQKVDCKQETMQSTLEVKMKEVSASQQMSQDMLKRSEDVVKGRVDELKTFVRSGMTDVKADIEMKTSACRESITKETQQVSRQVQTINKGQEEMSKTLESTKADVDFLKATTAATRGEVEKVAKSQLQRCTRRCKADNCRNECVQPLLHNGDCRCDLSGCTHPCMICKVAKCRSFDHLHMKNHFCYNQHPCTQLCEEPGICVVNGSKDVAGKDISQNSLRMVCAKTRPVGSLDHIGQHSCGGQHTCEKRCAMCGHFCQKLYGHRGACTTSHHGPAENLHRLDGARIRQHNGVEVNLDATLTCGQLCQSAGRGHSHIMPCTCKSILEKNGRRKLNTKPNRVHLEGNPKKDLVAHNEFWQLLQPSFLDPATDAEKKTFGACPVECPHDGAARRSLCKKSVHHEVLQSTEQQCADGRHVFHHGGHRFCCEDHRCPHKCHCFSWTGWLNWSCDQACVLVSKHKSPCRCEHHSTSGQ